MNYDGCTTPVNDPMIVVQENKSRFEVKNPKRNGFYKVEVDGCLISDHRERCDWIIYTEEPVQKVLYIELKGCGIDKAISQLMSTLEHTSTKYEDFEKSCFAVTTRIPKHGASIRKKCLDFHRKTSATLSVKNINASITL